MKIPPLHEDESPLYTYGESEFGSIGEIVLRFIIYGIGIFVSPIFLIFSCLIRRPRESPNAIAFKSLFFSIICFFIYISLNLAGRYLYIKAFRLVADIFSGLNAILLQHVIYNLINAYNSRYGNPGIRSLLLSRIHAMIISSVIVLYAIGIICDIAIVVSGNRSEIKYDRFVLTRAIIFFIPSLDIIVELFIIFRRPRGAILTFKKGTIGLIIGASFFFILSLYNLVHGCEYYKTYDQAAFSPGKKSFEKVDSLAHIVDDICMIGIYAGIIHCCMQLHRPYLQNSRRHRSTEDERSHMLPPSTEESQGLHIREETTEILSGR